METNLKIDYRKGCFTYTTNNKKVVKKLLSEKYETFKPYLEFKDGYIKGINLTISIKNISLLYDLVNIKTLIPGQKKRSKKNEVCNNRRRRI